MRAFGFLALQKARFVAEAQGKPMPEEVAPRPELDIVRKRKRKSETQSRASPMRCRAVNLSGRAVHPD